MVACVRVLQGNSIPDLVTHPSRLWRDVIVFDQPKPLLEVPDRCPLVAPPVVPLVLNASWADHDGSGAPAGAGR
jgi:hypothetical protein